MATVTSSLVVRSPQWVIFKLYPMSPLWTLTLSPQALELMLHNKRRPPRPPPCSQNEKRKPPFLSFLLLALASNQSPDLAVSSVFLEFFSSLFQLPYSRLSTLCQLGHWNQSSCSHLCPLKPAFHCCQGDLSKRSFPPCSSPVSFLCGSPLPICPTS